MLRMSPFRVGIFTGKNYEFSQVSLSGAMSPDLIVTAQGNVNNPPVVSVHVANRNRTADALAFSSHALGMLDKILSSILQVPFNIDLNPDPFSVAFVDNFFNQRLHGVKSLSVSSNQNGRVTARYIEKYFVRILLICNSGIGCNRINNALKDFFP